MRIYTLITILMLYVGNAAADNQKLLDSLDTVISHKAQFVAEKENRISSLKRRLSKGMKGETALQTLNDLYEEYHVFQFDSAMAYADKGLSLARQKHNDYYTTLFAINRSEILAIGGLYTEAIENLGTIGVEPADSTLRFKYLITHFTIYSYWSDYCHDKHFAPLYRSKADDYLRQAMAYADVTDPLYEFYQGEVNVYVNHDNQQARQHYLKALQHIDENSRAYSMTSFALAGNYHFAGEKEKYMEYVIKAALGDLKNCTMENMALQDLAVFLFEEDEGQIERAERYINQSMEDANIIFISLLVLGLLLGAYYIHRQNRKLSSRRKELANSNLQLSELNQQLSGSYRQQAELNSQLQILNQRLVDTNKRREGLASIYIDLCAKYIEKLGKYQTLVKRKIKANQTLDLLQTISSTRISEEDASTFLHRFDKAFLELYPTFVEEFNALLRPDERIQQKTPHTLTTELRTFALIRLGVKNTADIAGLLFLSNQTIYNCRSLTKNKAVNKDTFDEDVLRLCTVIK